MRSLGYLFICSLAIVTISCKGSDSSDSTNKTTSNGMVIAENGLCTQAMIDIHNDVLYKADSYTRYKSETDRTALVAACDKYKASIGSNSCKAQKKLTGTEDMMTSSSLVTFCSVPEASTTPKTVTPPTTPTYPTYPTYPSYSSNSCSTEITNELRNFEAARKSFSLTPNASTTYNLDASCKQLKLKMGYSTCSYNYEDRSYFKNFEPACDKIETLANYYKREEMALVPKVEILTSDITDGTQDVSIIATQPNTFNQLVKSGVVFVKAGMALKSSEDAIAAGGIWCKVDVATGVVFNSTKEITLTVDESLKADSGYTVLRSENDDIVLTCTHTKTETTIQQLTVAQLKVAIGKWFKIKTVTKKQ